jgi:flavin-dependent dehydrogenase
MGPSHDFDVVIAGAGPAGSALARRLALRGCRVALIERTGFDRSRIGESLAPDVKPLLQALDAWTSFLALRPLPSWGVRADWGAADEAQTHSHVFSPHGCGWHIDRCAFDRMLAQRAVDAGAVLLQGTAVHDARVEGERWRVELRTAAADASVSATARVVVDATGRRAQLARRFGARRIAFDRLVGVAAHLRLSDADTRGHLRVEAAELGWWYFAPLPDGVAAAGQATVAMLMTDADLCSDARLSHPLPWLTRLRETSLARDGLCTEAPISTPRTHCAGSHRIRRDPASLRERWLTVGDAGLAVDPVSGSGVLRALASARAAADAVLSLLDGAPHIDDYENERDQECTRYLFERAAYYACEDRWPDAAFWRRRVLTAATAGHA